MKLTQEEKRIKIAEARGVANRWHIVKHGLYFRPGAHGYTSNKMEAWVVSEVEAKKWEYKKAGYPADHVTIVQAELPDYFNDLNALYGAWESLTDDQKTIFASHIRRLHEGMDCRVFAAFKQHGAECIGLTLNLWEAGA